MTDVELYFAAMEEELKANGDRAITHTYIKDFVLRAIALTREDCAKYHEDCAEMNERACGTQFQQSARWHRHQAKALRERGK